jgi:hypothetical protein
MKSKAGKGLACKCRKIILFSAIVLPLVFTGCKKSDKDYTPEAKLKINPFIQPNDSTLNWYGSADVNKDNTVNAQDLTMLNEIIAGTYSNPSDTRLMDRADVNGDGVVNSDDAKILEDKLNGSITYLPGEWNELPTRSEKEDWLNKMLAIDKTNEVHYGNGVTCLYYADQLMINFNGFDEKGIRKLLNVYPYDISNNGRFNIPVKEVGISYYEDGIGGHGRNTVILGGNALDWNGKSDIEPQNDQINVATEKDPVYGINSMYEIFDPGKDAENTLYMRYNIKNNIPTLDLNSVNPNLITHRGK